MKTDKSYHVTIKPETGSKLKFRKEEKKENDTLPSTIGVSFKDPHDIKEERMSFKTFLEQSII